MAQAQQAQQADRALPQAVIYLAAALVAAVVLSVMLVTGNFQLFGAAEPEFRQPTQAVLQSEANWLEQRLAQGGYIEPAVRSAREWERQRLQQSGASR